MAAELTPTEILTRAREVYASCRTYRDDGTVVTRFAPLGPQQQEHSERIAFSTLFVRPDRLRFEYAEIDGEIDDRMLILWNASGVRVLSTIEPHDSAYDSPHDAIEAATGVSGGSSYTVPTLLVPGRTDRDPLATKVAQLRGRERIDGQLCFVLAMEDSGAMWIGCNDFLIRRVDTARVFAEDWLRTEEDRLREILVRASEPHEAAVYREMLEELSSRPNRPFRAEDTTIYEPRIDDPIDPEHFEAPARWPP